jgi:hypothetical protein
MVSIFGIELIKINFFMRGLIFSALLILALHYGVTLVMRSFQELKRGEWKTALITAVYTVFVSTGFYFAVSSSLIFRILFYVLLTLYLLVLLSRGFINWYSRTEEISKKMDRIIELLEGLS